jgi:hypothetical protein
VVDGYGFLSFFIAAALCFRICVSMTVLSLRMMSPNGHKGTWLLDKNAHLEQNLVTLASWTSTPMATRLGG